MLLTCTSFIWLAIFLLFTSAFNPADNTTASDINAFPDDLDVDPSTCTLCQASNPWKHMTMLPDDVPPPPDDEDNLTDLSKNVSVSKRTDSTGTSNSRVRARINDLASPLCECVAHYQWTIPWDGTIRSKPISLDSNTHKPVLVWSTSGPVKITVWYSLERQPGETLKKGWHKVYEGPIGGASRGNFPMRRAPRLRFMVDLAMPYPITGEIAMFGYLDPRP